MADSWKKIWNVRSSPETVRRILKSMPRVYEDGRRDGVIGWVGRTYTHQRRDFKPKSPKLTVDKEQRLVFQHEQISPLTYAFELNEQQDGTTAVKMELRTSSTSKDSSAAEQVIAICYALTKALEPLED